MYLLKRKDEVFQCFVEWKAMVENSGGGKFKVLRSDNGGEYTAKRFQEYLKAEGVRHEVTVPKTSQQNGVVERLNRTLMEMVRTMLIESNLDQRFWGEAMSTAVYLRNRSPIKAVIGMTPHEALYGEKPNMRHLRAFGCASYPLIMKDERKKLDPVTKRCVLVGYGTEVKGYRLYDSSRGKVLYSRDVKFNEMEFGLEKEAGSGKSSDYVELDVSSPTVEVQEGERRMKYRRMKYRRMKYRRMKYRRMKYRRMKYRRANYVKTRKVVKGLPLNGMWRSQEYAGRLETGRGQIIWWKRYLLPRIVRKNQLLSRKRLKARNMLNGRKPWKPKCNLCKLMVS